MAEISNQAIFDNIKQIQPDSYKVESFDIIPHTGIGDKFSVKGILSTFTIKESIYEPWLHLEASFLDAIDFSLLADLSGQERIIIKLSQSNPDLENKEGRDTTIVNLEFYVTEYPSYAKNDMDQAAVYILKGVSKEKFESEFLRVSKSYKGSSNKIIKDIIKEQLGVKEEGIIDNADSAEGMMSVLVPNMKPLNACSMVLSNAYDEKKSPIYFYKRLDGKFVIESQTYMYDKESYGLYRKAKSWELQYPREIDNKRELLKRFKTIKNHILSDTISPKMSKFISGSKGAYAAKVHMLDCSTKSYKVIDYKSKNEQLQTLDPTQRLADNVSESFLVKENSTLTELTSATNYYISENKNAYRSGISNMYQDSSFTYAQRNAYKHQLETVSHDLILNGDLLFKVGSKITINISKSLIKENEFDNTKGKDTLDEKLTGNYIVTSIIHFFAEEYKMNVRVKKDNVKLLKSGTVQ